MGVPRDENTSDDNVLKQPEGDPLPGLHLLIPDEHALDRTQTVKIISHLSGFIEARYAAPSSPGVHGHGARRLRRSARLRSTGSRGSVLRRLLPFQPVHPAGNLRCQLVVVTQLLILLLLSHLRRPFRSRGGCTPCASSATAAAPGGGRRLAFYRRSILSQKCAHRLLLIYAATVL